MNDGLPRARGAGLPGRRLRQGRLKLGLKTKAVVLILMQLGRLKVSLGLRGVGLPRIPWKVPYCCRKVTVTV